MGIDVIPAKTCSLDCRYCESGRTTQLTCRRREFVAPEIVLAELDAFLRDHSGSVDALTLSAAGEPTLYSALGDLLQAIKRRHSRLPLVVISNGSLFWDPQVRRDLMAADLVMPSLDAADPAIFAAVNRPHPSLDLALVIEGLRAFRREFSGTIALEVLLVRGWNDAEEHLHRLRRVIDAIAPDRVDLNTVVRPPAVAGIEGLDAFEMAAALRCFPSGLTRIIGTFEGTPGEGRDRSTPTRVLEMIARRPCSLEEMSASLGISMERVEETVLRLERTGAVIRRQYGERCFICPAAKS